ncbi:chorismate mutase [Neisseria wadsworthii 9715]|uniref:chorismate mutase n=2 Tax=Neisseria TaxID=482 RepID=G4CS51_9NEIS|nr:chorismate mutase [Neisseria wadsworthii 9715]
MAEFALNKMIGKYDKETIMTMPETLNEVRRVIDDLDGEIIQLLARRQKLVEQAGRLKPHNDARAVAAPERVAQVIEARRVQAISEGLSPEVAEAVWRAMIDAFINLEIEFNKAGSLHD